MQLTIIRRLTFLIVGVLKFPATDPAKFPFIQLKPHGSFHFSVNSRNLKTCMLIFSDNRAAYCFAAFLYPFVFPDNKLRLCALSEHPLSAFSASPRCAARYTVYKSILERALQHHQEALVDVPPTGNQSLLIRWRRAGDGAQ